MSDKTEALQKQEPLSLWQKLTFPLIIAFVSLVVGMLTGQGGNDLVGLIIMFGINLISSVAAFQRKEELNILLLIYFNVFSFFSFLLIMSKLGII